MTSNIYYLCKDVDIISVIGMKKFLKTVVLLAVIFAAAGCVNINKLDISSIHVDSITPAGFRSLAGSASVTVDNRSVGFEVYDIGGIVKKDGMEFGSFAIAPIAVKARTKDSYTVSGQVSLSQSVSVLGMLSMFESMDIDDFTVDISLKVKAKGGAAQKFALKDVPARDVFNAVRSKGI